MHIKGVSLASSATAEPINERRILSEPVRICNEGARTGLSLLGVSKLVSEASLTEGLQL